jgi:hypothetical protein
MTLLLSTGWHHHGWFLLWPLIPLFWIGVLILFARFVVWRGRPGPWGRRLRRARPAGDPGRALRAR